MADMKIALAVDANNPIAGDLYFENGDVRLTNSLAEDVAQELYIRLRAVKGEWFLDATVGIPYFEEILGQKTDIGILSQIFRSVIGGCPGVASLPAFSVERVANRGLAVTWSATLADGTTLTSSDFVAFVVSVGGT